MGYLRPTQHRLSHMSPTTPPTPVFLACVSSPETPPQSLRCKIGHNRVSGWPPISTGLSLPLFSPPPPFAHSSLPPPFLTDTQTIRIRICTPLSHRISSRHVNNPLHFSPAPPDVRSMVWLTLPRHRCVISPRCLPHRQPSGLQIGITSPL